MTDIADAARKIPGVAAVEGAIAGAVATEADPPIKDYDKQTAGDIAGKLNGFSQRELRTIDASPLGPDERKPCATLERVSHGAASPCPV